jgi:hypothetical protein
MKTERIFLIILMGVVLCSCNFKVSKEAARKFEERQGPFSVSVFPVRVVMGGSAAYDTTLSNDLSTWLHEEEIANAVVMTEANEFPVQWHHNQAKMLKESARAFADHIMGIKIQTDYALLVEILCNRDETHVGGVHHYLTDSSGKIVDVGLNNSHWSEYQAIQPVNRVDGLEVAKLMMQNAW